MSNLNGYKKETFLEYLISHNVSNTIIEKFNELPEKIVHKNAEFVLHITSTWHNTGKTHYDFEMNYYSEELIEYMFTPKVFQDIEKCVNFLLCELFSGKFVEKKLC